MAWFQGVQGWFNDRGFPLGLRGADRAMTGLGVPLVLARSGVAVPLTGTTAETTLAQVTVPGGLMGPNGMLRVTTLWSYTNSANNKSMRAKFGGWNWQSYTATSTAQLRASGVLWNRGDEDAQVLPAGSTAFNDGATTTGMGAATINTAADQVVSITAQLASAAELITLEAWTLEVIPS